ncbi:rhomboid family intramembrane serine protease [Psychroflexus planctonicus]|uniref:Rhomboid family intramembrane serine protease n=1 Tax=Psychroflexus planctonicus TaxID=1526575 RepID=A0ABQ1SD56_9FLAO|nr:rhomboid family intramembrane serine protease [Psychroflexus planctonicus]GGE28179.1 rhomboid family intramembrane serine protease [Psychroflexus planctonicus]
MSDWQQNFRYKYATSTVVERLIGLNLLLFVLTFAFQTIGFFFEAQANYFVEWLIFPADPFAYIVQPWSIITYAFLHNGFIHILFNMIVLYFSGRIFLQFYSPQRMINFYVLGAIFGALIFMLSFNLFPVFSQLGSSKLLGASAAVMAILIGVATKVPNYGVRLFLFGNVKLWHIAVVFVILDFIRIPFGNPGGHLAHLGGAFIGYYYSKQLDERNDLGSFVASTMHYFQSLFDASARSKRNMKTVHKSAKKKAAKTNVSKTEKQKRVDQILDKISKSGYESLSKEEKDFLFDAGKDM